MQNLIYSWIKKKKKIIRLPLPVFVRQQASPSMPKVPVSMLSFELFVFNYFQGILSIVTLKFFVLIYSFTKEQKNSAPKRWIPKSTKYRELWPFVPFVYHFNLLSEQRAITFCEYVQCAHEHDENNTRKNSSERQIWHCLCARKTLTSKQNFFFLRFHTNVIEYW